MRPKSRTMHKSWIIALVCALFGAWLSSNATAQESVQSCVFNYQHNSFVCEVTPTSISTAEENGHLIRNQQGVLIDFEANNWSTSAGITLMVLDATAIPSNGTLAACTSTNGTANANPCILKWYGVPAATSAGQPGTVNATWAPGPFLHYQAGLVFVCSTTGPFTLTLAANCTFSVDTE
jgi:hypothetical protein